MYSSISIRPSKELRTNYSQISKLARNNPVAITVNGKEDTVVVSHEEFVDQQQYIQELKPALRYTRILHRQWMMLSSVGLRQWMLPLTIFSENWMRCVHELSCQDHRNSKADLREIAFYIAEHSMDNETAKRFIMKLREQCKRLVDFPQSGAIPKDHVLRSLDSDTSCIRII